MNPETESERKNWTKEKVETVFKEILVDALAVDADKVVPEASLVHDLGAESIDFLDVGFRVQQTFGVELPNKAVQEKILKWRSLAELRQIIQERYGASIPQEEMKQLQTLGIPGVLRRLAEEQGVGIGKGEAEKIAEELANRLAREVESIGFQVSLVDRANIMKLLLEDLDSPKIVEGMLRLLSVGGLVDFIAARVGADGEGQTQAGR